MKKITHYSPTENGYGIRGSTEIFNRPLYGSHLNDDKPERFFTFAGDAPQFMGAVCDWTAEDGKVPGTVTFQQKCGVLVSGLAITPGQRSRFYYSDDIDQTSRWFHNSEDIYAEFKTGWMEYTLSQMSSWFPDVRVSMEAYPLLPEDGYLVHYKCHTDQRVYFTAGFGGITDIQARFEYKDEPLRYFTGENTKGNTVTLGKNRACITHTDGKTMRVATSFPAEFGLGSAKVMAERYPSTFLTSAPENEDDQVVKISAVIEPDKTLEGYIIALYNSDEKTLDKWLSMEDPVAYIKQQIFAKVACIGVNTPEKALDLTIDPTVIALDSAWHKDSFYHGAFAYHAPFLGWRNWYAPTQLGWNERMEKTIGMWLGYISKGDVKDEKVWYDAEPIPDGENKFQKRWHNQDNPVGRLPAVLKPDGSPVYGPYNMQECALDMMLYYIQWTGDMALAEKYFDDMCAMAQWERRTFDPDDDGLYQNFLNTWISDGHNYNGAGCAQSSAYNYRANLLLGKIAERIGRESEPWFKQAEKIKKALNEKLWLANDGVIAESLDTIGNCMIHPSVELATVYHVMDSEMIDDLRAYRTLRYTEHHLRNIVTPGNQGRLCYSSAWLPKQYSNCGIFPAENAHLALMYFKLGLKEEGKKLLDGIADCYYNGKNPGLAAHIQSAMCASDFGDIDFSDVAGTYLRLVVEGLFGIRLDHLDNVVHIAPGLPEEWEHASLNLKDITLHYARRGNQESYEISCDSKATKRFRIPMRAADVDAVLLDGQPVSYEIVAAPNCSFIMVETGKCGRMQLRIIHGNKAVPTVEVPCAVLEGSRFAFCVKDGTIVSIQDISETLEDIKIVGNKIYASAKAIPGDHTLFVRVQAGRYDTWLAADYRIEAEETEELPAPEAEFEPVDISSVFNCNMKDVHEKAYVSPRPEAYSMSVFQNGRYSHNWNQYGCRVAYVDDSYFRTSGGKVYSPSGVPFVTPAEKENLACVSLYDVFPTAVSVPLSGKAKELAVLFVASTYCMQSYVENARITVTYADGTKAEKKLVYPINVDDWLTSALTTEGEIFYFNNFNHGTVQHIRLDPNKELASVKIEAVANEIVLGVAGISIGR